jgi:hypothetical protein
VIEHVEMSRWFEMPMGCPTHVGWQVGHLALAKSMHMFGGLGAPRPSEDVFDEDQFKEFFGGGSVPTDDPAVYPEASELFVAFDRIHAVGQKALARVDEASLDDHVNHPIASTKYELAQWNAQHAMLHGGQIGLIRRLLGLEPWR